MRAVVLGLAASAAAIPVSAAPAQAEHWSDPGFIAAASVAVHRGGQSFGPGANIDGVAPEDGHRKFDRRHGDRHDRRRRGGFIGGTVIADWDWQGDSAWRANSYNDWWHERPNRAFPRWMLNNHTCERQWWSGAGWRC